jgi:hypothetical protein
MALYAGIDLHSNNSVIVIQDEQDNVVGRKHLPNDLKRVCSWLASYQKDLGGRRGATYNWYRLVDG